MYNDSIKKYMYILFHNSLIFMFTYIFIYLFKGEDNDNTLKLFDRQDYIYAEKYGFTLYDFGRIFLAFPIRLQSCDHKTMALNENKRKKKSNTKKFEKETTF